MTGRTTQKSGGVLVPILLAIVFTAYASLRWASESPAFEKAKSVSDTPAYIRISDLALSDADFWFNARPFIFPLAIKISQADPIKIAAFQAGFSILSWGALALAMAFSLKHAILRPLVFCLILAFSLERHIAGWDVVMLTESLSLSLMALLLAAWLWLLKGWNWWKAVVVGLVAFLWAFSRDTNAWVLLMLSGLIFLAVLVFAGQKRLLTLALLFVSFFILNNFSANKGERWVFPIQNVLAERILTNPKALSFLSACGMPVTPELMQLVDSHAGSAERAFYSDPALETYRAWLHKDGKACYTRWLLSVPIQSFRQPLADFEALVTFERVDTFFPQRYTPLLPWSIERIVYPRDMLPWLWGLTSIIAGVAIVKKAWRSNPTWCAFIGLCLLSYPHLFIVWHGDTSGIDRHALSLSVQFLLCFWLLVFLLLEKGIAWLQGKDHARK